MALLCGRAFYLLECFLRQAVMLFVWFIASACPGRSEPARSGSSVFSHVHRAVALSTEIYCSVGGEAALCLGVTLHMNSHTALLVVLSVDSHRAVHLSFRSKSTAPKVDSPSHSSPHLFRPPPLPTPFMEKEAMSESAVTFQHNPDVLCWCVSPWPYLSASLSPLWCQDKQGCDNIYPFCLSWGFAGAIVQELTDGSGSLEAVGRDERESSASSHPSNTVWLPNTPHILTWYGRGGLQSGWWRFYTVRGSCCFYSASHFVWGEWEE